MQDLIRINEREMLRTWAIAEASSVRRWKDIKNLLPKETLSKIKNKQFTKLSEDDYKALEQMITQFRSPLLGGLFRLKPDWWKGYIEIKDLESSKMMNWPPFVDLAGSNNLSDLIDEFEKGNYPPNHKEFEANLNRVRRSLKIKEMMGAPIFVANNKTTPPHLIEGFTRCSAILMNFRSGKLKNNKIPIILGLSKHLKDWYLRDDKSNINLVK